MPNSNNTQLTKFASPLPKSERESISRDASRMIMQKLTPVSEEAQRQARRAELGYLALELTREEYDSPQAYLNALDAYEAAWESRTLPATDLFSYVSPHLEAGRERAKALLAAQGVYQTRKRQWVVTVPHDQDNNRNR